ncbi:hypothetical protein SAMCFNEI73_pB0244 (plasmid) [Sinorhizobium americanum]|uniref:Uncharacterized protein n=1 Tax=Sinorhizobium americanum TaxID=194963 RepID=A0A1L3LTM0_9HYPH|nr:hypothetical protein SAMCFNEI73_pB0244 [Sinorhizobium americanum]
MLNPFDLDESLPMRFSNNRSLRKQPASSIQIVRDDRIRDIEAEHFGQIHLRWLIFSNENVTWMAEPSASNQQIE